MKRRNVQTTSSLLSIAACAAAVLLSGCTEEPKPKLAADLYVRPIDASLYTDRTKAERPPSIRLRDATAESGIDFVHETGAHGEKLMPETIGSGVCLFDADNDGDLDAFFVNAMHWPGHEPAAGPPPRSRFFLNDGSGHFADATDAWGLGLTLYGMGACAGDFDNDGDLDLFVTAVGPNVLLRNEGGRFVDATEASGVRGGRWTDEKGNENDEWSTGAVWLDYDRDGHLDLFVANYVRWSPATDIFATLDGTSKGYATPSLYDGQSCRLYRGRGDGTFEDRTEAAGVRNDSGKSMAVALDDFDGDGPMDIVVTNDTQPNFLYRNNGDGAFEDVALEAGIGYDEDGRARAGMGVDIADLTNSGQPTIAIGNFSREPISLYQMQEVGMVFIDVAGSWKLSGPSLMALTFPILFHDLDADGWVDLFAGNGHIEPEIEKVSADIAFRQKMQVYRNEGGKSFAELGIGAGEVMNAPLVVRGLAAGDLDNDGDLDIVLTQNGDAARVLFNDSPGANERSIAFDLRRATADVATPGAPALGATVHLVCTAADGAGAELTQRRVVRTGSSYLSQSDLRAYFGVPIGCRPHRATIRWPDGKEQTLEGLLPGAIYRVVQGSDAAPERLPFRTLDPQYVASTMGQ